MSHLGRILGHDDHQPLERVLESMHQTIDGTAHDVMVLGELARKSASLKRELKLDHTDTTSYELYVALRQRVVDDNVRLARVLGIQHENAVSEATPRIVRAVSQMHGGTQCFVPKAVALKKILKQCPPKLVMKALHYRSVDSLLKHELPSHIVVLARYLEGTRWQTAYREQLSHLTTRDFEQRQLEIVWLDKLTLIEPLISSQAKHHLVMHAKEAGCVAVAPTNEKVIYGYTIRTLVLLEHYVQEIRYLSSYAKTLSTTQAFGETYAQGLTHDHESHLKIAHYPVHWRSMHHAIAVSHIQDILPPHLSVEQWHTAQANDVLSGYNELVSFWDGYGHVVTPDTLPVSANIVDLAIDGSHDRSFDERSLKYGRRSLEQELFGRYIQEPRILRLALHRLNVD